jgi:hypothetical protein
MAFKIDKQKLDNSWYGVLLGILLPIITFFVNYLIHFRGMPLFRVFITIHRGQMEFPITTFCILPSVTAFFIFMWIDLDRISRGLLYTILPYVIFMVWKFST